MNACNPQTFCGRLAELSPFEIKVATTPEVAPCQSTANRREAFTHDVAAEELYGCVDWYQYPGQV